MSKPLTVSQGDILRGKIVTPGWYPAVMKAVEDVTSKSTGVEGWKVTFVIEGNSAFKDVPVDTRFWENAPGFTAPLIAVLTGKPQAESGNYSLDNGVGKRMMIYVSNGLFNGRKTNQIDDFKPIGQ